MADSQQPTIWAICIIFSTIAIVAVILRFWARRIMGQKLWVDDWAVCASLILAIAVVVNLLIMTELGGLGTHLQFNDDGSIKDLHAFEIYQKTTYAFEILAWPSMGLTKIAVILLYKRIFTTPGFQRTCWFFIALNCAWTLTFTFALAFGCTPISSHWDLTVKGTCVDEIKLYTAGLATDTATDFLILLLPIHEVWNLQMSTARKAAITGMFLLGGLVSIVGVVRIHFLTETYEILTKELYAADSTYLYTKIYYWQIIEVNVGVLSACLPTLRPIHERLTESFKSTQLRSSLTNLIRSLKSTTNTQTTDIRLNSMEEGLDKSFYSTDAPETQVSSPTLAANRRY